MQITVEYFTFLRNISGKEFEQFCCVPSLSISALVAMIVEQYGDKMAQAIYTDQENDIFSIAFLLNRRVSVPASYQLQEGDSITLIPRIGGG